MQIEDLEILTFVERDCTRLCDAVVDHAGYGSVARHRGRCHDVAFLRADHARQKCLCRVPHADDVDVEDLLEELGCDVQDCALPAKACIVAKDRDGAEVAFDCLCGLIDIVDVRDISLVKVDIGD